MTEIIHSHSKMLFSWRKICLSKFLWCAVHIKLFFTSSFARVNKSLARCLFVICQKRSEHLVEKKLSLVVFDSNCSFKTLKYSFFNQIIVYQSFYGAPLTFNYVLLQGKVLCFASASRLRETYLQVSIRRSDLVEKSISPVIFDTNRSFSLMSVSARVSKSIAWTVFTCVEKMLSIGCVRCMKMGLKRVSPVPFDKKTVNFWLNGKNDLRFN